MKVMLKQYLSPYRSQKSWKGHNFEKQKKCILIHENPQQQLVHFSKKIMKRYPIFSLQINYYQINQIHKSNILLAKFYFNSFKNGIFVFSPYGIMPSFTWF